MCLPSTLSTVGSTGRWVHSTTGRYAVDLGALAQPTTSGVFSTPANGSAYTYSTGFPDSTSTHNYWVDVTFTPNP